MQPTPTISQISRPPLQDALVGTTVLGRYRIQAKLGEGGTSTVYRGVHVSLDRVVAVKVMRPDLLQSPSIAARLLQEGKAACRIRHEHVAYVTDFGVTHDGNVLLVMEYLEGETLDRLVDREGALPWPRARAIALQICDAVHAAHEAGVIHRDLTLGNCFRVTRDGNSDYIKVIDFGIARALGDHVAARQGRLTRRTEIFGTPEFMAPEQARAARLADARSDVYALGVQLYALVTGRLPLHGPTPLDTLVMQLRDQPVAPSELARWLPPEVDRVVLRAMAKDPDERYQSIADFAADLRAISALPVELPSPVQWNSELDGAADTSTLSEDPKAAPRRRRGRLAIAAVVVGALAAAGYATDLSPEVARRHATAAWGAVDAAWTGAVGGARHTAPVPTPVEVVPAARVEVTVAWVAPSAPPQPIAAEAPTPPAQHERVNRAARARKLAGKNEAAAQREAAPTSELPARADVEHSANDETVAVMPIE